LTYVYDIVDGLGVEQSEFYQVVGHIADSLTKTFTDDQLAVAVNWRAGLSLPGRRL